MGKSKAWWCLDCRTPIELDRHGRCCICGSDAVDSMLRAFYSRMPVLSHRNAQKVHKELVQAAVA
jgi:hypothetical protein